LFRPRQLQLAQHLLLQALQLTLLPLGEALVRLVALVEGLPLLLEVINHKNKVCSVIVVKLVINVFNLGTMDELFGAAKNALGLGATSNLASGKSGFGGFTPAATPGTGGDSNTGGRYTGPSSMGYNPGGGAYSSGAFHLRTHTTTSTQNAYDSST
jgi:hypothetical protein